jgi:hypothetical protein
VPEFHSAVKFNLGVIEVAELPGSCAKIHGAKKILILFFYPAIVRFSREEENRQSEKLHLTLNSSRSPLLH